MLGDLEAWDWLLTYWLVAAQRSNSLLLSPSYIKRTWAHKEKSYDLEITHVCTWFCRLWTIMWNWNFPSFAMSRYWSKRCFLFCIYLYFHVLKYLSGELIFCRQEIYWRFMMCPTFGTFLCFWEYVLSDQCLCNFLLTRKIILKIASFVFQTEPEGSRSNFQGAEPRKVCLSKQPSY